MSLLHALAMSSPRRAEQTFFNVVTYTGNGSDNHAISGVGFQPDLVQIKRRTALFAGAVPFYWIDAVRGITEYLSSSSSSAEVTTTRIESLDSDGFTLDSSSGSNASGIEFVAFCWKADNTSGSSNTSGTITSTVAADKSMGFSIVSYTGTGANATVGHGLGYVPDLVIVKNRDSSGSWAVYSPEKGATNHTWLDSYIASQVDTIWNDTAPVADVFSIGTDSEVNTNGDDYIAYCFRSVPGVSKIGNYVGNGSATGPIIDCGFEPLYLLIKNLDGNGYWFVYDSVRDTSNPRETVVYYDNLTLEEVTEGDVDFNANGFQIKNADADLNTSGADYQFFAIAEFVS